MPKIQAPIRLRLEDFDANERKLAEKIGNAYNTFNEDVYNVINGNIDFTNLKQQIVTIDVQMGIGGSLATPSSIGLENNFINGIICLNAVNLDDNTIYPTSTPFVSFQRNNQLLSIQNITGLQDNSNYRLTLLIT